MQKALAYPFLINKSFSLPSGQEATILAVLLLIYLCKPVCAYALAEITFFVIISYFESGPF
jgi:hypothetical protein